MLIATPFACTLTTDFDGLSGGLEDAGGDASLSSETGTSTEAGADAGDGYRLAVMADKPSAYWTFDEPAGSMGAADVAGPFDARVDGVVTFGVAGVRGGAIQAARTGKLMAGDVFDFSGQSPYSLEAWIRYERPSNNVTFYDIFTKRDDVDIGYALYVRDEPPLLTAQWEHNLNPGGRGSSAVVKANVWTHLVVTYEAASWIGVKLYVDGVLSMQGDYDDHKDGPATSSELVLAAGFVGTVDEMAIYEHALTEERVKLHAALGKP